MKINNKQIRIRSYFVVVLLALISFGISSCADETEEQASDIELIIPSSAYSFTITSVDNEDESIVYIEPSFTNNFETLGCSVTKVIYYIDNVLASTETNYPFNLQYKTTPLSKGQHIMKAVFTVGGEGFKDATVEYQKMFSVGDYVPNQAAVKFDIEFDRYLRVGDKVHISVKMVDRYNAGYRINEAKCYFDNSLIATKTDSPYDFDYTPTLIVGQRYPLEVDISYTLDGVSFNSYGLNAGITVLADDETRYLFDSDYSYNTHFNNGEVISGTGLLYRGKGDNMVYELNLYWDDKLVGTSQTFPYKFSHTIRNASQGIHKFKQEWKQYDKKGNYKGSESSTETITIDK